ncbi:hypothetical protein HBN50_08345 [Halobacteriovorax sp. GB3]|uniref:hypothetical protein n=1 Tax=Halobacteriovorax sp. GB3 TaxID=2719615 RepID=UPI0023604CBB|nr:hypothetical protein [Halobacteriovorax sp. GB3]MDD0853103.1 hypothetical protein [Halobacteriovorax sp. GB3]
MNIFQASRQESIKKLIEFGKMGFYPLFDESWMLGLSKNNSPMSQKDQERAAGLLKRLTQHRTIERQKTVLFTMKETDRELVMKTLIKLVEGKILDETPMLH